MPLPPKLNKFTTASPIITSVDFTDIATGRGTVVLQSGTVKDANTLTTITFYSHDIETIATDTEDIDKDFDMVLIKPFTIEGSAIVNVMASGWRYANGAAASSWTVTATLRKWDGTTETDLATDSHDLTTVTQVAGQGVNKLIAFNLDLPRTAFAKGETLRLNIFISNSGANRKMILLHDPKNRLTSVIYDGSGTLSPIYSKCEVYLPIVLEL